MQPESREHLAELPKRACGGEVFTTIHKFMPEGVGQMEALSGRENIVVIAEEAHRSQYGFDGRVNEKGELSDGFANNLRDALPNASFIGFTVSVNNSTPRRRVLKPPPFLRRSSSSRDRPVSAQVRGSTAQASLASARRLVPASR